MLLLHVVGALSEAVDAQAGVSLPGLAGLHLSQGLDRGQAGVLRQSQGHALQGIRKRPEWILLQCRDLVRLRAHSEGTGDLGGASAIHNPVVLHQVADHAQCIVQATLGLFHNHLVAAPDEDGDGPGVWALLDDQHAVLGGAERELPHHARRAQLVRTQLAEAGHDAAARGNGDQLDFWSPDPAHGGQLPLEQQVVGLIVEAPLADDQVGPGRLHLVHHQLKLLLLVASQGLELLRRRHVQLVLRLGLGRLKRAGQDRQLGVAHLLGHLWVAEVLVDQHPPDQQGVLQLAPLLALHLDQLKVHVPPVQLGHRQHSLHRYLCKLPVALVHYLGAQGGHGCLNQLLLVVRGDRKALCDRVQVGARATGSHLEAVRYPDWVDAPVQQLLRLLQQRPRQDHDPGGAVADLVVLRLRQLHQELGDLVVHVHHLEDGRPVVCHRHVAV
uniref:Secreted protein n=1 Tax=Ixodes ricinus TaxID=34613 RepID=A0A6B0VAH4_IXORI